jgi:translation initiation factor IF-2
LTPLAAWCTAQTLPVIAISALTGEGIPGLLEAIADRLRTLRGTPHVP